MPHDDLILLNAQNVSKRFEGVRALDGVSLEVRKGALHGIIGPNGSGKTTLFNALTGLIPVDGGTVWYRGENVTGLSPHLRSKRGIGRTFQQVRLFGSLTVQQNILAAYLEHQNTPLFRRMLSRSGMSQGPADEIIDFFGLRTYSEHLCSSLPYGIQKVTEMARAMVSRPELLMLDEPVNGMNAEEVVQVRSLFRALRDKFGTTILLIEHNMTLVMSECDMVSVLSSGLNLAEGTPREVASNPKVIEAYLGKRGDTYVA